MKYKIPNKKQLKIMHKCWKELQRCLGAFSDDVMDIEVKMSKKCKIEGMEFLMCDNEYVGIGNVDRTLKLTQRKKLD